jgi:crotonobetainyl-CoA:carnitine CoA-transferase CaiB-like acyl-CoA transferase
LLKNIRVLDLADEKGSLCSKLLADLGATVLKLEPSGGDPSSSSHPYRFFYDNLNKSVLSADLNSRVGEAAFRELLQNSDVLVETFHPRSPESIKFGPERLRRLHPRLVHLSITAFGRTGPRSTWRSSDAIASASGGQMYVCGRESGPPVKLFGSQSLYTASLFGAVAILLQLRKRVITSAGGHIDLSIQEAVASTLDGVLVDYFHEGRIAGRRENRGDGFTTLPSSDGYVQIPILRSWDTLIELMASEGCAGELLEDDWREPAYREKQLGRAAETVCEWTRRHTKRELLLLGQAMHFPWASVDSLEEVLKNPQLESRGFFFRTSYPGGSAIAVPGLPYKFSSFQPLPPATVRPADGFDSGILETLVRLAKKKRRQDRNPCAPEAILKNIRVLDLTRMLSGPYATRILADFGADVIKIRPKKAVGAEREHTAYFRTWNRNKKSLYLDLNESGARKAFLGLAAGADIVIENFSPRVMANWGLEYETLRAVNPGLVMVSISATGRSGPWKDFVGFAPTFHALSGLVDGTSGGVNPPAEIGHAYADVIAGLYAALAALAALEFRDQTGEGQHVDLSALESVCTLLGPEFIECQLDSSPGRDRGYSVFQCAGKDRWCVISIENEEQARTLAGIAGSPELTDTAIRRWMAGQNEEAVVERLQGAGLAAGVVQNAMDLARDPQMAARRFFISLQDPVIGEIISDRSALWNWRRNPRSWKPFEVGTLPSP